MADAPPGQPARPTEGRETRGASRDVFVSHASPDAAVADTVVEALEKAGLRCWIAPRDVVPGAPYADGIVRAINDARVFVLVLSGDAVASPHVSRELERAASKRRPIVALRTDTAPLTPAFEYFLSEPQWIDVGETGLASAAKRLVEAVRRHLDPSGANSPVSGPGTPSQVGTQPPSRTKWMVAGGAVILALALAFGAVDNFWPLKRDTAGRRISATTAVAQDKSIAVLPFTDMSEKSDQEYFADGMAEEVLDILAKIPGLRVIGRTSSFQFKGKSADLRTIGATLGAAYILEGSVRRSGDRLRVTAQLIAAQDGSHLWSETYDGHSGDALKVQEEIAVGLVRALEVTIGADDLQAPAALRNPEAYELYLRGRHALDQYDKAGFDTAVGYFEQSLALDPTFSQAAEWLGIVENDRAIWGFVPPAEGFGRARLAADRALKANRRSGLAHTVLAVIHSVYDWDWPAVERESALAMALEPRRAVVIGNSGYARSAIDRPEQTVRLMRASIALDPLNAPWHEVLGLALYRSGALTEAEAEIHRVLQISPSYASAHFDLGQILLAEGKPREALLEMQQESPPSGRDAGLAIAYHVLRRGTDSDSALARFTNDSERDSAYLIAAIHAYRGELDDAFNWLERAYAQKDNLLFWIKGDPLLRNLERDPRYRAFLHKMNLPE